MFCTQFETYEESINNFPNKTCEGCKNYQYSAGIVTCAEMENKMNMEISKGDDKK